MSERLRVAILDPDQADSPALTAKTALSTRATKPARKKAARRLPLMVRRKTAARLCGISLATWDRLDAAGKTPAAVRLGGAKLYRTAELAAWTRNDCPPRAQWAVIWANLQKNRRH